MGCICSKQSSAHDYVAENEKEKGKEVNRSSVQVSAPKYDGSLHSKFKTTLESNAKSIPPANVEENKKTRVIERPKNGHQMRSTMELGGVNGIQQTMPRIITYKHTTWCQS
ncbi:hypothetical protein CDL12_02618 [Handroanthus impetiginosus]|uniref:Uncharacterized protein n=1 Tax=Handroanthus impetiginosus TaxID=429701 RepID=A0A2G9I4G7_9LAMI|nr:hypothetical protein CDL12_02618 [Handroanthus impetiginosus]